MREMLMCEIGLTTPRYHNATLAPMWGDGEMELARPSSEYIYEKVIYLNNTSQCIQVTRRSCET